MKMLRLTRHEMSPEQEADLLRIFGDGLEVETVSESLPADTKSAVARFDELATGCEVAEVVLPVNLLEAVLKFSKFSKSGGMLLRAVTNRNLDSDGNATFTFDHYEEVVKVEVVTFRL